MLLAKVVGTLVATRKDPKISGLKFLVLRQVNPETLKEGGYVVANDAVGCGVGEIVSTHIIARPHVNVDLVLPLGRKDEVEKEMHSRGGK